MPRKKTIDSERIELKKIVQEKHLEIVEKKDCFSIELVFNAPFTDEQWDIMEKRFKFTANRRTYTISRAINNSWKGLVMALLSLAYCKHGKDVIERYWDTWNKIKKGKLMLIDFYYENLLDRETKQWIEHESMKQEPKVDIEDFMKVFNELTAMTEEEWDAKRRQEIKRIKTKIIAELPPDDRIEEVAVPKGWRALYVRAEYEERDIQGYLVLLGDMLDLDLANSYVGTEYSKEFPHTYSVKAATPKYCGL